MAESSDTAPRDDVAFRHAASELTPCGDPQALVARATRLIADDGWLTQMLAPSLNTLAADPMAMLPMPASRDAKRTAITLFETPAVRINLALLAPPPPDERTAFVVPGATVAIRYLRAGDARLERWRAEMPIADLDVRTAPPARLIETLTPADGAIILQRDDEALIATASNGEMVTLTATIFPDTPRLMCEYSLPDGTFIRAATRDQFASRGGMLLTLLRVQGRTDASDVFEAASRDAHFHTRWNAMREWLALDAVAALPRLRDMAMKEENEEVRVLARTILPVAEARTGTQQCHA